MKLVVSDDLIGFVTFSRDYDHVAFKCACDGEKYRVAAIRHYPIILTGRLYTDFYLTNDLHRVFRAGIVRSYYREVAILAGDPAHRNAFCLIAIAAAAKNGDDPSVGQIASSSKGI